MYCNYCKIKQLFYRIYSDYWWCVFVNRNIFFGQAMYVTRHRRGPDFDGGGRPNHKSHAKTSSEIFKKRIFWGTKMSYRMKDQKPWPGLTLNQDFAKEKELKPKVKNENV